MAATVKEARLRTNPEVFVKAADYRKWEHGAVLCPQKRCLTPMLGVSATRKNVNGKPVNVDPLFRLPPNAEKDGKGHTPVCKYNIQKTVTRWVARSREFKNFDKDAELLLEGLASGKAEFRLHILMDALSRSSYLASSNGNSDKFQTEPGFVGTRYIRSSRQLKAYLKVAKAILSLQARVQERPELEEWISLIHGNQVISWAEYFFDLPDYGELYEFLAKVGQFKRMGEEDRPVAVVMQVKQQEPTLTRYGSYQIRGRVMRGRSKSFGDLALGPVIYTRDKELAYRILDQQFVLVCAIPTIRPLRQPDRPTLWPFSDLNMTVSHRAQVCQYFPSLASR